MGTPTVPTPRVAVRWGLPDALIAWVIGIVAGVFAAVPFIGADGTIPESEEVVATLVLLAVQNVAMIGSLVVVSRYKGRGSLRLDFGLTFVPGDLLWVLGGVGLAVAAGIMVLPITELAGLEDSSQDVVQTFERSAGVLEKVAIALGVVLIAPVAEELLFRGVFLRSLVRRWSPLVAVNVAALVFALVHVLGDPGTGYYVPAFLLLGLVSGWRAMVTGRIGQSVCLHAGFNLLAAIQIVT
jgi:membrane protease YdiL (CAAX protease family)